MESATAGLIGGGAMRRFFLFSMGVLAGLFIVSGSWCASVTFTSTAGSIQIGDFPAAGATKSIEVPHTVDISGITVTSGFTLTLDSDVRIDLFAPAGTGIGAITLYNGFYGNGVYTESWSDVTTPDLLPLLAVDAAGIWSLQFTDITDDGGPGTIVGNLNGFELTVEQAVPIPATIWLFGSALGIIGWMRQKRS